MSVLKVLKFQNTQNVTKIIHNDFHLSFPGVYSGFFTKRGIVYFLIWFFLAVLNYLQTYV